VSIVPFSASEPLAVLSCPTPGEWCVTVFAARTGVAITTKEFNKARLAGHYLEHLEDRGYRIKLTAEAERAARAEGLLVDEGARS